MFTPIIMIWLSVFLFGALLTLLGAVGPSNHYRYAHNIDTRHLRAAYAELEDVVGPLEYQGAWNASTNSPALADGTGEKGSFYIVSTGATRNLGSGNIVFTSGDWCVYNGATWSKVDASVTAVEVSIADALSIITATEVEGALQENRTAINANTVKTAIITRGATATQASISLEEAPDNGAFKAIIRPVANLGADRVVTIPDAAVDLADVGLNNSHRTGTGSDHADVAANTVKTAIITRGVAGTQAYISLEEAPNNGTFKGILQPVANLTGDRIVTIPDADVNLADATAAKGAVDAAVATTSGGAGNAGKLLKLDSAGQIQGRIASYIDRPDITILGATPGQDDLREAGWAIGDRGICKDGDAAGDDQWLTFAADGGASEGYQTITDPLGAIAGGTALAQLNTYDLDFTIDGVAIGLVTSNGMAAATIAAALTAMEANLQVATGNADTLAIVNGRIECRSLLTGVLSTVLMAPGTGNNLIAALNAALTTTVTLDTPLAGVAATPTPKVVILA